MFLALVKTRLILTIELIFRILQQTGRQAMVRVTRKVLPASWSGQHSCWHGLNFSGQAPITEGWPSGLRRTPGKRVGVKAPPGFESPSLRHTPLLNISFNYGLYLIIRYITYTYAYILL